MMYSTTAGSVYMRRSAKAITMPKLKITWLHIYATYRSEKSSPTLQITCSIGEWWLLS